MLLDLDVEKIVGEAEGNAKHQHMAKGSIESLLLDLIEFFNEREAIIEHDGKLDREDASLEALQDCFRIYRVTIERV